MKSVRIGVDATCWTNRRGYGRHIRALLNSVLELDTTNRYVFFTDSASADLPPGAEIVRVHTSAATVVAASSEGRRRLTDLWTVSRALSSPDLDCVLFPTVYSYVPVFSGAYKIVIIHDVIPEAFPEYVFPTASGRLNWKMKSFLARRQADLIVTVSEFSRQRILEYFGESPGRVKVVGEAADPAFRVLEAPTLSEPLRRMGLSPGDRLLVFVGGLSPHKNLLGLLDAFADVLVREDVREDVRQDVRMVLVGDHQGDSFHSCYREIQERIVRPPLQGRVILTGYVPDEDLVGLLNLATALVLPSFEEGFGLPAIEAAASGLPVVATTASPLPELLGDGALYIDPNNPRALVQALEQVLTDAALRLRLREAGLRAVAALSWDRSARDLIAIFEQAAHHAKAA